MLRYNRVLLGTTILLAMTGYSLAQPSQHIQPSSPPSNSQQSTPSDQKGTEQSPFVIKIVPTPQTPEEAHHLGAQEADKSNADWWLVKFTGGLVVVGLLQLIGFSWVFGWQGVQLRRAVKASRDEFLASHRPQIRVKHLWLMSDVSEQTPIRVKMVCVNTGTANATLQQMGIRCYVFGNEYLLPADPNMAHNFCFNRAVLECGVNWTIPDTKPQGAIDTGRTLAAHEWLDIQRRH